MSAFRLSRSLKKPFTLPQSKHFPVKTDSMLPKDTYKDKLILCTGGGTGLGRAMSTKMAELGGTVVIASRRMNVLEQAADEMNEQVGRKNAIIPMQLDIKDTDKILQLFENMEHKFGQAAPDVIINNAAANFVSPTERLSHNAFNVILDTVLKGTVGITLEAGKRMIKVEQPGTFLAITTTFADSGSPFVVPSATAKSGVEALVKSLSAEWGRYGIRMNIIAPGGIYTEGAFSRLDPTGEFLKGMVEDTPVGRLGEKEEIANLASYLCSDYASWMNGEIVTFDGGNLRSMAGMFDDMKKITPEQWDMMEKLIRGKSKSS